MDRLPRQPQLLSDNCHVRFGLDGWDPSKPRAVGTENFDAVVDRDASGVVLVRRMFGSGFDEVLSRSDASGVRWYGTDRLGTVHEWFDAAGVRVGAVVQFDGYGTVVSGALADRYGFTGREWDSVVGLQYSRARMYSPTQGRFTSEDPLGLRAGDANFYRYVGNQPTGRIDPSGYDWLERFQDGWDHLGKGFQELPAASERAADRFGERLDNLAHGRLNPDFVNGVQKLIDDPAKNFPKLGEIIVDDLTKAPRKLGEGLVTGDGRKIVEGAAGTGLMYFGAKQAGELVCRDSDKFLKFLKSEKGTYPNVPRTGGPQAPRTGGPLSANDSPFGVPSPNVTGSMDGPLPNILGVRPLNSASSASMAEANAARDAGFKRGVANALETSGGTFTGRSTGAGGGPVRPDVQAAYNAVPPELRSRYHGKCAEPRAISNALDAGVDPAGGTSFARLVGGPNHGAPKPACPSCQWVLNFLGIKDGAK